MSVQDIVQDTAAKCSECGCQCAALDISQLCCICNESQLCYLCESRAEYISSLC